jgi:FkbM family methyltransferase
LIRTIIPVGLWRIFEWKARFESLGFSSSSVLRSIVSRANREALINSRVEHLPIALRRQLSLVVDVGANTGQWLGALRKFVKVERAEVFEPNPEAFEVLKASLGDDPGIRLHLTALGSAPGISTLHVMRTSSLSSLLRPVESLAAQYTEEHASVLREVEVPVTTLDSVLPRGSDVDLLKIDVQGFERAVLLGGLDTLKRTRALLVEMNFISHYEGDDTFASLADLLIGKLGFEFWDMSAPHRGPDGRALWADAVFTNPAASPAAH